MPVKGRYRFGSFELFPDEYRLLRDGEEVALEPKVVELVVHILEARGAVLTKKELHETLWPDEVVGDAALARLVYQARKALGDDARNPRFLHTVHGRGYRFGGGADWLPDTTEGKAPAPAEERPRHRARLVFFVAVLGIAVALGWGLSPRSEDDELPGEEALPASPGVRRVVALVAESPPETSEDQALVGVSVVDLLHQELQARSGLIVRTPRYEEGPVSILRVAEIAEQTGADAVVASTSHPSIDPRRAQVRVRLFDGFSDTPRLTPLGDYSLPLLGEGDSLEELLDLRDAIGSRVVESLEPMLRAPSGEHRSSPRHPEAYRLYLLGYQKLRGSYCGGAQPAIELFERSIEQDAAYGPAWLWMGVAYYNRVWACGEDASNYDAAFAAIEKAAELDPTLGQARVQLAALFLETGRVAEAFEVLADEFDRHGESAILVGTRSYALRVGGFLDASLADLRLLLALDPLAFENGMSGGSPNTLLYLDRRREFLEVLPALEMPYFLYYRGFVAYLEGRLEEAREILEPAYRDAPGEIFGRLSRALLAVLDGDRDLAQEIVVAVSRQRDALGAADSEITYKQAQLLALSGDASGAFEELDRAVGQGFSCPRCLAIDPVFDPYRGALELDRIVQVAAQEHQELARRFGWEPELPAPGRSTSSPN